jgi:twitching motility protein PilT
MVNHINENDYGHILTVEDPIEFVHESKKCLINQREVGPHTLSFSNALRSALREDPDAMLVGEMRDLETIRLALTAAETGHLVFGTLHTSSARPRRWTVSSTSSRRPRKGNGAFDAVRVAARGHFADAAQDQGWQGRVAAHEIMIGTPAIRNLIRENKVAQMYSAIQTGQKLSACRRWTRICRSGAAQIMVSSAEARNKAANKDNFPG